MRLIAFDTATEQMHLAVVNGADVAVRCLPGGAVASAALLPAVRALLADAGLALHELDAVAFGRGPGAFTGLRTACAVAQGLAVGLNKPVLAIDTLMAVAESARRMGALDTGTGVWAATDARMGEVYAQRFVWDGTTQVWQADRPAGLYAPTDLAAAVQAAPAPLCGSALRAYPELSAVGAGGRAVAWAAAEPDGHALAALAATAWQRGQAEDAALALPLYVRDKVATTSAERAAARG